MKKRVTSQEAYQPYEHYAGQGQASPSAKRHDRQTSAEMRGDYMDTRIDGYIGGYDTVDVHHNQYSQDVCQEMMGQSGSGALPSASANGDQGCFQELSESASQQRDGRKSAQSANNTADLIAQAYAKRRQINQSRRRKHSQLQKQALRNHSRQGSSSQMTNQSGSNPPSRLSQSNSTMQRRSDENMYLKQSDDVRASQFDGRKYEEVNENGGRKSQNTTAQRRVNEYNPSPLDRHCATDIDSLRQERRLKIHSTNPYINLKPKAEMNTIEADHHSGSLNDPNYQNQSLEILSGSKKENGDERPLDNRELNIRRSGQNLRLHSNLPANFKISKKSSCNEIQQSISCDRPQSQAEKQTQDINLHEIHDDGEENQIDDPGSSSYDVDTSQINKSQQLFDQYKNREFKAAENSRQSSKESSHRRSQEERASRGRQHKAKHQDSYFQSLLKEEAEQSIDPSEDLIQNEDEPRQYDLEQERLYTDNREEETTRRKLDSLPRATPPTRLIHSRSQRGSRQESRASEPGQDGYLPSHPGYHTNMNMQEQIDQLLQASSQLIDLQRSKKRSKQGGGQSKSALEAHTERRDSPTKRSAKKQSNKKQILHNQSVMINNDAELAHFGSYATEVHDAQRDPKLSHTQLKRMKVRQKRQESKQRKSIHTLAEIADPQDVGKFGIFEEANALMQSQQSLSSTMLRAAKKLNPSPAKAGTRRPIKKRQKRGSRKKAKKLDNRDLAEELDEHGDTPDKIDASDTEQEMNQPLNEDGAVSEEFEQEERALLEGTFNQIDVRAPEEDPEEGEVDDQDSDSDDKDEECKSSSAVQESRSQLDGQGMDDAQNSKGDSPESSTQKKDRSAKFQKDLIVLKLNQRLKKLNQQKEFGNLQFEKSKASLKEFYSKIRQKIDDVENKAQNDLRGNLFIRSQNFSRMINQIQFQIDQLNVHTLQDDAASSNILSQTQVVEFTKSNIDQVINQADKFLAIEKQLQAQLQAEKAIPSLFDLCKTNSPSKSFILETINEFGDGLKSQKLVQFPNYSQEVLQKLIKVELDFSGFNCDKFDFINAQLGQHGNPNDGWCPYEPLQASAASNKSKPFLSSPDKKVAFGSTLSPSLSSSNLLRKLTCPPSATRKGDLLDSGSRLCSRNNEGLDSTARPPATDCMALQAPSKSVIGRSQSSKQLEKMVFAVSSKKKSSKKGKQLDEVGQPTLDNYQLNQETERTYSGAGGGAAGAGHGSIGNVSLKSSPIKVLQSQRSLNPATTAQSPTPKPKRLLQQSQLNSDLDFDLENQLEESVSTQNIELTAKGSKPTKSSNKKQPEPKMTKKSLASIKHHIQRIQTCSSVETVERVQKGGGKVQDCPQDRPGRQEARDSNFQSTKEWKDNQNCSESHRDAQTAFGSFTVAPVLSNVTHHPGHTFGKSDLNSRRNTSTITPHSRDKAALNKGLSQSIMLETNASSRLNDGRDPRYSRQGSNRQSTIDNDQRSKRNNKESKYEKYMTEIRSMYKAASQEDLAQMRNTIAVVDKGSGPIKDDGLNRNTSSQQQSSSQTDRCDQNQPGQNRNSFANRQSSSISDLNRGRGFASQQQKGPSQQNQEQSANTDLPSSSSMGKRKSSHLPNLNQSKKLNQLFLGYSGQEEPLDEPQNEEASRVPQIIRSREIIRREGSVPSHQGGQQNQLQTSQPSGGGQNLNLQQRRVPYKNLSQTSNWATQKAQTRTEYSEENETPQLGQKAQASSQNNRGGPSQVPGATDKGTNRPEQDRMEPLMSSKAKGGDKSKKQVILMSQAPEDEQNKLNQQDQMYNRQRVFTKIISQADRIQFQWSHPTNYKKDNYSYSLQYILEYGCGIKISGVEQFRKIYQGRAHKCIVADLMPKTTYRFRVRPVQVDGKDGQETASDTKWSEIVSVQTLEKGN